MTFSISRDFITKNGIVAEGDSEVTTSTGNTSAIQSAGGIAAAKSIVVGNSATVYGDVIGKSNAQFVNVFVTSITASTTSSFLDLYVRNIISSGVVSGTITGDINTATNLAGGQPGQIPYQTAPGATSFIPRASSGTVLVSNFAGVPTWQNTLTLASTTIASNTESGALQVRGGVGIGGDLYVGGSINAGSITGVISTATTATFATSATWATNAVVANTATFATSSSFATSSTWASNASLASTATFATSATWATNSVISNTATFATSSTYASGSNQALASNNLSGGTQGAIPIQSGVGQTAFVPLGTNGYVLTAGTSTATWQSLSALSAGNAVTATNVAGGTQGQILFQTNPGATGFTGPGTGGQVLVSAGTTSTGPVFQSTLTLAGTTGAVSTQTGAFQVRGGAGIGENLYVGGDIVSSGEFVINSTQASTGTAANNALYLKGGAYIEKSLVVEQETLFKGQVIFSGSATYIYSTNTVFTDNLINLHMPPGGDPNNHTWTVDDGKDIGHVYHYYKGSDKNAFLGLANDTAFLEFYSEGDESGGVFTGTSYGTFKTGSIKLVSNSQNNQNTTTGALQVLGGLGLEGNSYFNGQILVTGITTSSNSTDASSTLTGSLQLVGGAGIRGSVFIGGNLNIDSGNIQSASPIANLLNSNVTTANVLGAATAITLGNTTGWTAIRNDTTITSTTAASSPTSGALRVLGGAGISGALYVAGIASVQDLTNSASTSSGALTVAGGVGIGSNLVVGGTIQVGSTVSNAVVTSLVSNNVVWTSFTSNPITNTVTQTLDQFSTSTYRSAKYVIQIIDGASYQAQELLMFHDNTQTYMISYAIIHNNSELGVFDSNVSSGNVRLLFTAAAGVSNMIVKLMRTGLTN